MGIFILAFFVGILLIFFCRKGKERKADSIPKLSNSVPIENDAISKEHDCSENRESLVQEPQKENVSCSRSALETVSKKTAQEQIEELKIEQEKRAISNAHYDCVFIDLEATSYDERYVQYNDILQIAIVDRDGNVLIDQYCKPRKESWDRASKVNDIYPFLVENCPRFKEVKPYVQDIFDRSDSVITFDYYLVRNYLEKYKFDNVSYLQSVASRLREYNRIMGIENPQWTTLEYAASEFGLVYDQNNAVEDAKAILALYNFLEENDRKIKLERKKSHVSQEVKRKYKQNKNADSSGYFYGKKIAFVDELPIPAEEACKKVSEKGAIVRLTISASLDILVCGSRSPMLKHKYGELSTEQRNAEKLNADGARIQIITGEEFMELLDKPAGTS